jgi:type III pantothenate kinase
MKYLAIDIGNTRYKALLVDDANEYYFTAKNEDSLLKQLKTDSISETAVILCDVLKQTGDELLHFIKQSPNHIILSHQTPIPLKNLYETPDTLGYDRIAGAVGAFSLFPNSNCLIIDAGTAITYDIVNEHAEYMGGSISPGINMRYKALHQFTGKLPLLEFSLQDFSFPAKNTESCIHTGIIQGVLFEIEKHVELFEQQYSSGKTIISGGDSYYLVKKLKKHIFAQEELVLKGLIKILKYNVL